MTFKLKLPKIDFCALSYKDRERNNGMWPHKRTGLLKRKCSRMLWDRCNTMPWPCGIWKMHFHSFSCQHFHFSKSRWQQFQILGTPLVKNWVIIMSSDNYLVSHEKAHFSHTSVNHDTSHTHTKKRNNMFQFEHFSMIYK